MSQFSSRKCFLNSISCRSQDLPQYRDMVTQFYADIARLPQISDQEMGTSMQQLSIQQNDEFDTIAALKELYIYVTTYKEQVSATLDFAAFACIQCECM